MARKAKTPPAKPVEDAQQAVSAGSVAPPTDPEPAPTPAPEPEVDDAPGAAPALKERAASLKLRELVDRVSEATGGKKKDIKEIIEATLTQLGEALAKGEELNLPGVGKVRVARSADKDGRSLMTLKVRGVGGAQRKGQKDALADADEDV